VTSDNQIAGEVNEIGRRQESEAVQEDFTFEIWDPFSPLEFGVCGIWNIFCDLF
jgi:hypothetical protein